jgi:hypothetical protein
MVGHELLLTDDKYFLLLSLALTSGHLDLFERSIPNQYNRQEREKGISSYYVAFKRRIILKLPLLLVQS